MRVGSLFSGIGGLDLGLERAGMSVAWQAETDPYCTRVLKKHWPNVPNLGDITAVDWTEVEPVDLVCGGFPCQPVSLAGKRAGQDDERWLWPEFARCVRALRPRYVLVENVPGLLVRGMGDVLGDLAACGYDTEWDCVPAAAVGAPHLRYRVFVVAYAQSDLRGASGHDGPVASDGRGASLADAARRCETQQPQIASGEPTVVGSRARAGGRAGRGDSAERVSRRERTELDGAPLLADADASGRDGWTGIFGQGRRGQPADGSSRNAPDANSVQTDGSAIAWQKRGHWAVEPDVGRVAHGIPRRVDRLRALGNAVVPQVAQRIGERLMETQ